MKCPYCGHDDQKVLDSRVAREGEAIRRRRECLRCERRFTTFEAPEKPRLFIVKRDGSREDFKGEKLLSSMLIAAGKRPVPIETLKAAAQRIERDLYQEFEDEVPSTEVGERVMAELRGIDSVAYIRYASVYREFASVQDFTKIVEAVDGDAEASGIRRPDGY